MRFPRPASPYRCSQRPIPSNRSKPKHSLLSIIVSDNTISSNPRLTYTPMEVPEEKRQPEISPPRTQFISISPIWKLTPRHNRSTLYYDSFELRAVARQLNKAIQGTNVSSPPFHRRQLDRIHKERNIARKVLTYQPGCSALDKKPSMKSTNQPTKGFVARLWKKVRKGLFRNDHKQHQH